MKVFKKILIFLGYLSLTGILVAYFYFASVLVYKKNQTRCQEINIHIRDSAGVPLTRTYEVLAYLDKKGWTLPGKDFSEIDLYRLEKDIELFGAVRQCNAVKNINGVLRLDIWQHTPLFILESHSGVFYVTEEGFVFPLEKKEKMPLLTVHGNVPFLHNPVFRGKIDSTDVWLQDAIPFVSYICGNSFWAEKTQSIRVEAPEDIYILPKENLILSIGSTNHFIDKMNKLWEFYRVLEPRGGEARYELVDARFKDQLVCKHRKN